MIAKQQFKIGKTSSTDPLDAYLKQKSTLTERDFCIWCKLSGT